jgi:hypothetical protein
MPTRHFSSPVGMLVHGARTGEGDDFGRAETSAEARAIEVPIPPTLIVVTPYPYRRSW